MSHVSLPHDSTRHSYKAIKTDYNGLLKAEEKPWWMPHKQRGATFPELGHVEAINPAMYISNLPCRSGHAKGWAR